MDHRASANISEVMELQTKIALLKEEVTSLKADLGGWKISFDVDVEPVPNVAGQYQILIVATVGEKGVRQVISQENALYLIADKQDITNTLAKEILVTLVGELAYETLAPKLSRALDNVKILAAKKGSL